MRNKIVLGIVTIFLITAFIPAVNAMRLKETAGESTDEYMLFNDVRPLENMEDNDQWRDIVSRSNPKYTSGRKGNVAIVINQCFPYSLGVCMAQTAFYGTTCLQTRGYKNVYHMMFPTLQKMENDMIDFIEDNIGQDGKLFIYIFGHGAASGFSGIIQINPFQYLHDYKLRELVDSVSDLYSRCIIVLESCEVGSFIDDLSGENRIVLSATDHDSSSYGFNGGRAPFSEKVFSECINPSKKWADIWEEADSYICGMRDQLTGQNPQYDDNGNGYGVGTYENADNLPMSDGHTSNPKDYDGTLETKSSSRSKTSMIFQGQIQTFFYNALGNLPQFRELLKRIMMID